MATGNGIDYGWFTYTSDNGGAYNVKVDKDWGNNAASGLTSPNYANEPLIPHGRMRLRKCVLQDPVSGRRTTRVLGTVAADAGSAGTVVTTVARGAGGTYSLTSLGQVAERRPHAGAIISKAEPVTT